MVNAKLMNFLLRAGDAAAINAGGFLFTKVDPMMNKVPFFSSVVGVGQNPSQAKWRKTALYTGLGLVVDGAMDFVLKEDEDEGIGLIGRYATDLLYGLSAGNIAGDPVIQNFPATYSAGVQNKQVVVQRSAITGAMG